MICEFRGSAVLFRKMMQEARDERVPICYVLGQHMRGSKHFANMIRDIDYQYPLGANATARLWLIVREQDFTLLKLRYNIKETLTFGP